MAVSLNPTTALEEVERIEVELLLSAIHKRYGYDFSGYAPASLRRRVTVAVEREGVSSVSALQERVLRDTQCMLRFINALSVPVTAMFRDPDFYQALRTETIPLLRTYPFVRIWHAGCATGEEVYSLAILLMEEGLYERCRIYATDLSATTLQLAQDGVYDIARMRDYTQSYRLSGGVRDFSEYYTADEKKVRLKSFLKRNVVFSQHNLVSDGSFNDFHLILCRNVMIYFGQELRARVHGLLDGSLRRWGVLGLGLKETLDFSDLGGRFEELAPDLRLYRKLR